MTPDQEKDWLERYWRKRREAHARSLRSRFRLVVNRGITPVEAVEQCRVGRRL